jgi:sortase A
MSVFKIILNLTIITIVAILATIYWPIVQVEIGYLSDRVGSVRYVMEDVSYNTFVKVLRPPNTEYSIIIPKIGAVAPVIDKVDPNDPIRYLPALEKGVAHAAGSVNPGEPGNVYLFAHSADAFYNVPKYNTDFFLLGKLVKGDEIFVYFKDRKYKYVVNEIKVVNPNEIDYLAVNTGKNTLTFQTGYPAGMVIKRLLVIANEVGIQ